MLTADLLRVTTRKERIYPRYVDPTDVVLNELAATLTALVEGALTEGLTRGELEERLTELEGLDSDARRQAGLVKLLMDRCTFEVEAPLSPAEVRQKVFAAAARSGPLSRPGSPAPARTATDVLAQVAAELSSPEQAWTAADLARMLYADDKDAHILRSFEGPPSSEGLLHRYNLALAQGVLYKAKELHIRIGEVRPGALRQLFGSLKFHQLLFRAQREADGSVRVTIDGPASLVSASTRYGLQLAQVLPAVVLIDGDWAVEAEIDAGRGKTHQFLLSPKDKLQSHIAPRGQWTPAAAEHLARRWAELDTGWTLEPGGLLPLGGQALAAPDFRIYKAGREAFLDILGFWRVNHLTERLRESPSHLLFAVSRRLLDKGKADPTDPRVLGFAEIINARELLRRVEDLARPVPTV